MTVVVLFGVLGVVALWLIVTLLRRDGKRTETVEGLRIEQQACLQARQNRVSFNAVAMHGTLPTARDLHHRRWSKAPLPAGEGQ